MSSRILRILSVLAVSGGIPAQAQAPAPVPIPTPASAHRVQPGLETAVKWKWSVLPSEEKEWGFPVSEPPAEPEAAPGGEVGKKSEVKAKSGLSIAAGDYEVRRGDALAKIAKNSGISVYQLKTFNALPGDTIRVGQVLKIPTAEEQLDLLPPPPPPPPVAKVVEKPKKGKKAAVKEPEAPVVDLEAEATLLQVFLDRENFTSGPIDGNRGAVFEQTLTLYQSVHQELSTPELLKEKATAVAGQPFVIYRLTRSDFRFIQAPKAPVKPAAPLPKSKAGKPATAPQAPSVPPPTYEELVAASYSAYRTPWEFVAERFHCDETFLHSLNPKIKEPLAEGAEFKVPNVIPFEVEKSFAGPLQPKADPTKPVTAVIVAVSRLEIRQGDQLIAAMPVSKTKPDLRGKGTWTVLAAIPGPRLATRQEPTAAPKPSSTSTSAPEPPPAAQTLAADQFLAAGPRNPVGICWINLAKANSTTPLPYGLHGTAIPSRMKTYESIGGFRMTNWDIARVVRLLPEGTPLRWQVK